MSVRCGHHERHGNRTTRHLTSADVRACFAGRDVTPVWPCDWLLPGGEFGGEIVPDVECGADSWYTDEYGSHTCAAGHDHLTQEALFHRGEAYASDLDEARGLVEAGIVPLAMAGGPSRSAFDDVA